MNKSGIADQVIAHPSGGGAIKGMGESFSPDLHTGTGNLTVPIAVPPGRGGIQPELTLTYSTGNGNGPFGLGWALGIPGVARDTSKQLPVYSDDQDTFLLSGAEQLVPVASSPDGATLFRPRTEGLFARIKHRRSPEDDYWEVKSRNGLTSVYGHRGERGTDATVIRDPDDPLRVFAWHLTETVDTFGNRIEYLYERDSPHAAGPHHSDQVYLRTIRYADFGAREDPSFLVTVDFVYESRPDPFSSYRAGFEVRTTRRCTRIEVRTHAGVTRLARVYHLTYLDQSQVPPGIQAPNGVSLLKRIELEGVDGEVRERMPPLEFGYTQFDPARRVYAPLKAVSGAIPERSLSHPDFELADLFGRGLPDVVQIGDVARYWRNLGGGRFDVPRPLEGLPAGARLGDRGAQLADFDGDGQVDLLLSGRSVNGYFPLTVDHPGAEKPFVQYAAAPPFALNDPELRLVDLDGDGITDALRTGTEFELYFHDRKLGWNRFERRTRGDIDRFPDVRFSDPRVKLADMTGDGLQDIVFVAGERVDYWPYLGNGRWGRRITMTGRIHFPDGVAFGGIGFDPKRLLLDDVDGDGLADLVYVESGRITIWLNQSGNGWSDPIVVNGTPPVTDIDSVRVADMLGQGTAGILWTYDFGTFADSSYKFLDLTGGIKPYLLNERDSHSGALTRVEYVPSTRFYLQDESRPETRWRARLPFPVQVVSRVEVIDEISGGKLTTEYRYHHGYWDGEEREFRGFGMVEQVDTETFTRHNARGLHGEHHFERVDTIHFSPPTLTRTFFHQGQTQDASGTWQEPDLRAAIFGDDPPMFKRGQRHELVGIARSAALDAEPSQLRHALRTLRGSVLRSELYALDDSPHRDRPYTVTESLFDVREIDSHLPETPRRFRVFYPFQIANRTTQWERGSDPMTQVSFTGGHDAYGMPHFQLSVAVPRGRDPRVTANGAPDSYLATYAVTEYARRDDAGHYIVDRTARSTSHEILNDGRQSVFELRDATVTGGASLQVIGHARSFYDGEAFVGLPLGQLGDFGALVRTESLVFTDDFLERTFDPSDPLSVGPRPAYLDSSSPTVWPPEYPAEFAATLPALAGYVHYSDTDNPGEPGGYFVTAKRCHYDFHDPSRIPRGHQLVTRDPLGVDTSIDYDTFELLPVRVTDAIGLTMVAQYDYRILQAHRITDPNGNQTELGFSPLGFVASQYVRGKNGEGDHGNPSVRMDYDVLAFADRGQPMSVRAVRRVHHDSETDVPLSERNQTIEAVEYSDGFGRLLQTRSQAEDTLFGDGIFGGGILSADQSLPVTQARGRTRQPDDSANVVVSGWQICDNKGRVVEKYEPFFSQGFDFEAPTDAQLGQKSSLFYDPRGQMVRTVNPDGSEQRMIFGVPVDLTDPEHFTPTVWEAYSYDANDNAGRTHPVAAAAYSDHWNTPASVVFDALGRTVAAVARNGAHADDDWFVTRSTYDIHGNLLTVTDALNRLAFRYAFDLAKRRWRVDSIDGGRRDGVLDAVGNVVESRDSKGALTLHGNDAVHRLVRIWARDDAAGAVTLRQRLEYGDGSSAVQPPTARAVARSRNLIGLVVRHFDEAGLATLQSVDFKGNALEKSRRVIADTPILAVFNQAPANNWQVKPFQVDWQPLGGQSLADVEDFLLEPTAYQTSATYDALNRIKQMQLPRDVEGMRHQLRPTYNRAGGLEKVFLDDALFVERIAYDAKGQRALIGYGNGVMTRSTYDPRTFRLTRLRSERYTQTDATTYLPSGAVLQDYAFSYDLAGNILAIRDRAPGSGIHNNPDSVRADDPVLAQLLVSGDALIRRFTYDPIYRLLSATGRECDRPAAGPPWLDFPRCTDLTKTRAYTERYRYDEMGNVQNLEHRNGTSGFIRAFILETPNNHLHSMQIGEALHTYSFDANGNMQSETLSRHFEWNHADQMNAFRTQTEGAEPSVYAHYLYDSAGQRTKKLVRKQGGQIEVSHYIDGVLEHHRWGAQAQAKENNHVHVMDDKQRVALVRLGPAHPDDRGPTVQVHLGDHLGSNNVVVDANGVVMNREEFTPYGESSFGSFARKRYRFTGKERDEESKLSYHSARYYAPHLGRWATPDPSGPADARNLYSYVRSNPLRYVDGAGTNSDNAPTCDGSAQPFTADNITNDSTPIPPRARVIGPTNAGSLINHIIQEIDEEHLSASLPDYGPTENSTTNATDESLDTTQLTKRRPFTEKDVWSLAVQSQQGLKSGVAFPYEQAATFGVTLAGTWSTAQVAKSISPQLAQKLTGGATRLGALYLPIAGWDLGLAIRQGIDARDEAVHLVAMKAYGEVTQLSLQLIRQNMQVHSLNSRGVAEVHAAYGPHRAEFEREIWFALQPVDSLNFEAGQSYLAWTVADLANTLMGIYSDSRNVNSAERQ